MLLYNRVILKQGSTLTDLSVNLNNPLSGNETIAITAATDTLILGSDMPFNHRWFEVSTANASASTVSVYLWSGSEWNQAVDVIDQTAVAGKTFAQSGVISWVPNRLKTWGIEDDSADMSDLSSLNIYGLYWVKIVFSGDLSGTTALKYVGHKFSSDADLASEYPDLSDSNMKTAFTAGKTDWKDQAFSAAEYIIRDLRDAGIVTSPSQILDWAHYTKPSIHKTAELIYSAFGQDYKDDIAKANAKYKEQIKLRFHPIDQNKDAKLNPMEREVTGRWMTR